MIALVDCNNFYASCQRLFRPDLADAPIVILSNNDGCIIARSNEAKALGVPMGAPEFKWRQFFEDNNVVVFSSNYPLYADLSARVMKTLGQLTEHMEMYSIDEAFLSFDGFKNLGYLEHGRHIKTTTQQWTGIPVSVGVGATKTLAKIAGHVAKKHPPSQGVFVLESEQRIDHVLRRIKVGDVWGVGRRISAQLQEARIYTAYDLKQADSGWLRRRWSVVLERTAAELNGVRCINIENLPIRKQIRVSRSFRERVTDYAHLRGLVAGYTGRAAEKLRGQKSVCAGIVVFIQTSLHDESTYAPSQLINIPSPSADTSVLIKAASYGLKGIYKQGFRYAKAGVLLVNITPEKNQQFSLFESGTYEQRDKKRMELMDIVNERYGSQSLRVLSESPQRWFMKQDNLSPAYTTRWQDLPVIS